MRHARWIAAVLGTAIIGVGPARAEDEVPAAGSRQRIEVHDVQEPPSDGGGGRDRLQSSLREIESAISEAKREVEALQREKTNLKTQLELAESRLEQANGHLAVVERDKTDLRAQLAAAEGKLAQAVKEREALESVKAALAKQLGQAEDELAGAKTEIGQLKIKRNELEELKRTLTKAQKDVEQLTGERNQLKGALQKAQDEVGRRSAELEQTQRSLMEKSQQAEQTLQKETASRDKMIGGLKAELEDAGKRIAQRDDQLEKLREVHATLDKQYVTLEATHKDTEAKLGALEQGKTALSDQLAQAQRALAETQSKLKETEGRLAKGAQELETLKGEKASLGDQLAKAQKALDELQKNSSRVTVELEDSKYRTQEFAKEMDALRNAQLELEGRLTATRDEHVKKIQSLQQELQTKSQEIEGLKQTVAAGDQGRLDLQDQLRVAKESQTTFSDQLKTLQAVQADRDGLQGTLNARDAQITKLNGELSSLSHELDVAKEQLKSADAQGQEHHQQLSIDRQGLEWRVDSLEAELKEARASEARLQLQLEDTRSEQQKAKEFRQQVADKLTEREAQLKQAESVIQLLQGTASGPSVSTFTPAQEASSAPSSSERSPLDGLTGAAGEPSGAWMTEGAGAAASSTPAAPSSDRYPVKIYQVNEELNFLVFSMEGMGWAKTGTQLLLLVDDVPIASVQLTELDGEGFAVAQITKVMDQSRQIRKGDFLFARPLMPVMGQ